ADLLLQLEHDALRRLLADPGDRLEPGRVLEHDRALQLAGARAGDDRERDLRADPGHREQLLEQLSLGRVGEAVQLERVLADMRVDLEHDLAVTLGPAERGRRGGDEVADAVDVEHDPVRAPRDRRPAQAGDHDATLSIGGASAWQIATASASDACVDSGRVFRARIVCTMRATWAFSARP